MRRSSLLAAIALTVLVLTQPSHALAKESAPEWVKSATSNNEGQDYVDVNSITRTGDMAQIRIRTEFAPGKSTLKSGEGRLEVDCKANKARLLSMNLVTSEGEAITIDRPGKWMDVVEGSPASNAAKFACREAGAVSPVQPRG